MLEMSQAEIVAVASGPLPARRLSRVHGAIAREIGIEIVTGRLGPGALLEGEIEASTRRRVSRTTYREALKILGAKGLVLSRTRTGTRVCGTEHWHLLDPDVLAWLFSDRPRAELIHGVFEMRKIVEPAAAALAATRRSASQLDEMRRALDLMAIHTLHKPQGRAADKAFHTALLAATFNPFIVSMTRGVTAAVDSLSEYKLRLGGLQRDPVPDHARVYDAILSKDANGARKAMETLIRLAILDMPPDQWPRPWK